MEKRGCGQIHKTDTNIDISCVCPQFRHKAKVGLNETQGYPYEKLTLKIRKNRCAKRRIVKNDENDIDRFGILCYDVTTTE